MNRQQRRAHSRNGQIGEPNLPKPGQAIDTRIVYGAGCTYWGSIYSIKTINMNGWPMPCCPHCHGLLSELPTEADYLNPADEHEAVIPGYGGFVRWNKGRKCLSLHPEQGGDTAFERLRAEYEAERAAGMS